MSIEIIIIVLLFLYILYLHYQIYRKNILIDSVVSRLSEIEKTWSKEYIINFLKKLQHITSIEYIKEGKLLSENVMRFIFENEKERITYIHYTREENIARTILVEGFRFVESFYKTAEHITNDKLDLIYKHSMHKYYGKYIVVISVSRQLYEYYEKELRNMSKQSAQVEQILTELSPTLDENNDQIYRFPPQFIKGYINYISGEIVNNPVYNPDYKSSRFDSNLNQLK